MGCIGKCMKKPNINLAPSTLAKKAMDGVGLLLITVTPLTRDDLQQRGHWDQKPGERLGKGKKTLKKDWNILFSSISLSNQWKQKSEMQCPRVSLKVHLIGSCKPSPPVSRLPPAEPAVLLWSSTEGRSYYLHRAQVRMVTRQHTIKS